jgi:hypothetical protein
MQTNAASSNSKANTLKRLALWEVVVVLILLIPFLSNAPWTGSDYVFAGIVLTLCATVYVYTTQDSNNAKRKLAVGAGVLIFICAVIGWAASGP